MSTKQLHGDTAPTESDDHIEHNDIVEKANNSVADEDNDSQWTEKSLESVDTNDLDEQQQQASPTRRSNRSKRQRSLSSSDSERSVRRSRRRRMSRSTFDIDEVSKLPQRGKRSGRSIFGNVQFEQNREQQLRRRRRRRLQKPKGDRLQDIITDTSAGEVAVKVPVSADGEASLYPVDPFNQTTCAVCGGVQDEDLIILCDAPGCNSETHLYCLNPILTAVPEGEWFCDVCDEHGSTRHLAEYFRQFRLFKSSFWSHIESQPAQYEVFLQSLQEQLIPFEAWSLSAVANEDAFQSEFDTSAADLIGCPVRLFCPVDGQYHTGRILRRRCINNANDTDKYWEHYIQFKSGGDGRNKPFFVWCSLREHVCLVGGAVVWARTPQYQMWPAQLYFRSGLERYLKKHYPFLPNNAIDDQHEQQQRNVYDPIMLGLEMHGTKSSTEECEINSVDQLVYFFVDEGYALVDKNVYIVDFYSKSRESRFTQSKLVNTAYALACIEREEMLSARRASTHFASSIADMDKTSSALIDGYHTGTLKRLCQGGVDSQHAMQKLREAQIAMMQFEGYQPPDAVKDTAFSASEERPTASSSEGAVSNTNDCTAPSDESAYEHISGGSDNPSENLPSKVFVGVQNTDQCDAVVGKKSSSSSKELHFQQNAEPFRAAVRHKLLMGKVNTKEVSVNVSHVVGSIPVFDEGLGSPASIPVKNDISHTTLDGRNEMKWREQPAVDAYIPMPRASLRNAYSSINIPVHVDVAYLFSEGGLMLPAHNLDIADRNDVRAILKNRNGSRFATHVGNNCKVLFFSDEYSHESDSIGEGKSFGDCNVKDDCDEEQGQEDEATGMNEKKFSSNANESKRRLRSQSSQHDAHETMSESDKVNDNENYSYATSLNSMLGDLFVEKCSKLAAERRQEIKGERDQIAERKEKQRAERKKQAQLRQEIRLQQQLEDVVSESVADENDAAVLVNLDHVEMNVNPQRKTRSQRRIEKQLAELTAATSNYSILLSDVDRADWPDCIVRCSTIHVDTERNYKLARVVHIGGGRVKVRYLDSRQADFHPYELEVVPKDSEEYDRFEKDEIEMICQNDEVPQKRSNSNVLVEINEQASKDNAATEDDISSHPTTNRLSSNDADDDDSLKEVVAIDYKDINIEDTEYNSVFEDDGPDSADELDVSSATRSAVGTELDTVMPLGRSLVGKLPRMRSTVVPRKAVGMKASYIDFKQGHAETLNLLRSRRQAEVAKRLEKIRLSSARRESNTDKTDTQTTDNSSTINNTSKKKNSRWGPKQTENTTDNSSVRDVSGNKSNDAAKCIPSKGTDPITSSRNVDPRLALHRRSRAVAEKTLTDVVRKGNDAIPEERNLQLVEEKLKDKMKETSRTKDCHQLQKLERPQEESRAEIMPRELPRKEYRSDGEVSESDEDKEQQLKTRTEVFDKMPMLQQLQQKRQRQQQSVEHQRNIQYSTKPKRRKKRHNFNAHEVIDLSHVDTDATVQDYNADMAQNADIGQAAGFDGATPLQNEFLYSQMPPDIEISSGAADQIYSTINKDSSRQEYGALSMKASASRRRINPNYPQFNHSRDKESSILHLQQVMPTCMENLNRMLELVTTSGPPGNVGVETTAVPLHEQSYDQCSWNDSNAFAAPSMYTSPPQYPPLHQPTDYPHVDTIPAPAANFPGQFEQGYNELQSVSTMIDSYAPPELTLPAATIATQSSRISEVDVGFYESGTAHVGYPHSYSYEPGAAHALADHSAYISMQPPSEIGHTAECDDSRAWDGYGSSIIEAAVESTQYSSAPNFDSHFPVTNFNSGAQVYEVNYLAEQQLLQPQFEPPLSYPTQQQQYRNQQLPRSTRQRKEQRHRHQK